MIDAKFLIDISTVPCVLSRSKYKNYLRLHLKFIEQYRWWCLSLLFLPMKECCVYFWINHCARSTSFAPLARPRKPVGGEIALNARSEPSPGRRTTGFDWPPSALRFNPSGFRRRTGHETAPPSRKFTKGLECLEGLESLVPAFYPS